MGTKRNKKGVIVSGVGSELTELQSTFLERVKSEGIEEGGKIAKSLNYTNYYRDRRTEGTAFYREIMKLVESEVKSIDAAKGTNLTKLISIRDAALANGDMKIAMDAIRIINSMQGYIAPVKVEQTKFDIKATIDLTAPKEDENDYYDIDFIEE